MITHRKRLTLGEKALAFPLMICTIRIGIVGRLLEGQPAHGGGPIDE